MVAIKETNLTKEFIKTCIQGCINISLTWFWNTKYCPVDILLREVCITTLLYFGEYFNSYNLYPVYLYNGYNGSTDIGVHYYYADQTCHCKALILFSDPSVTLPHTQGKSMGHWCQF